MVWAVTATLPFWDKTLLLRPAETLLGRRAVETVAPAWGGFWYFAVSGFHALFSAKSLTCRIAKLWHWSGIGS